ncbi:MAG: DUF433 domain-containing protein [Gemmatimonadetes bacterium]|nr:DUF433 domain-containing protein [Gemmatimonadota bacterium]MYB59079.1 DUF433 domain-containing protein [Gemmatimonadota bacterium]
MKHIISDPGILGGKPVIEGTRLSVEHILGLLARNMSQREIVEAYPVLTVEDVNGVLEYAAKALQNDIVIDVKMASGV